MNTTLSKLDSEYMQQAIALAKQGGVGAAPNPLVGTLLVKDGIVIGSGYHKLYGQAHSEVNALNSIPANLSAEGATAYVTLEPCSHYGKTPPCAKAFIDAKIKRVVAAIQDPNPDVAGKGFAMLEAADIEVSVGLHAADAIEMNRRFLISKLRNRPYIILKWAQSSDGFFCSKEPRQTWLTCEASKALVHTWRVKEQAIMVGGRTAMIDNPALTVRLTEGQNPTRIVLDRDLSIPSSYTIFNHEAATIFVNQQREDLTSLHKYWQLPFDDALLHNLMERLNQSGIISVLIEGGADLLSRCIRQDLYDEARIITAPIALEDGVESPRLCRTDVVTDRFSTGVDSCEIWRSASSLQACATLMPSA
jgi:diaminohydroxyphosphoribosylaminopyrimidine deaminase / 5-amino-6-(5-phosphoribosylamino)uracil reductase